MHTPSEHAGPAAIVDRTDPPRGLLNTAWPLAALALLLLMLVRACVPAAPPAASPPAFDATAAARQANDAALGALRALPPQPGLPQALAALNGVVINFATGSDAVPNDMTALLGQAAAVIAALPAATRIVITGHTDNIGDAGANLALSQRRAAAVRAALIDQGAPPEALSTQGVGDSRPVAGNDSEAGRFRNRRIEFDAAP